jgi:hypothetical protein
MRVSVETSARLVRMWLRRPDADLSDHPARAFQVGTAEASDVSGAVPLRLGRTVQNTNGHSRPAWRIFYSVAPVLQVRVSQSEQVFAMGNIAVDVPAARKLPPLD